MALRSITRAVPTTLTSNVKRVAAQAIWSRPASAVAVPTPSAPQTVGHDIQKEASLPNPDPPSDSSTAAIVQSFTPYMVKTYVRPPPVMAKGEGCYMWDIENRRYLDFMAGIAVNALGHADPEICELIYQQACTLTHSSNLYHNPWTGELSRLLVEVTRASGGMQSAARVFVCNSGTEANEAALKFARKVGNSLDKSGRKHQIVSFHGSFHGRTMGSLSATPTVKYQKPFGPMLPGFKYGAYNEIESLQDLITEETCGVIVEPIQGEGGVNVASAEFLQALRDHCNEVDAVLIYDEIQCGLSRAGTLWAHGNLPKSAHPDIITTAKALGNGYPVGATVVSEKVADFIVTGDHGTTFGGSPLACKLAHHIVQRLATPKMQQQVREKEQIFRSHFQALQTEFPDIVLETRGRGLLLGLQLNQDPTPLVTAARERGLLIVTAGTNTLRFIPPLIITPEQIEEGMNILAKAMRAVFRKGEEPHATKGQQEMAPEGR